MAVVPDNMEALPLKRLKDLLEATAKWGTWASPFGRVHYVSEPIDGETELTRPYAIVSFIGEDGFSLQLAAGGATYHYEASGSLALLIFADVNTATDLADQVLTFVNTTGLIIAQMAALSGAGAGAFAFSGVTRSEGPYLVADDEHADEPDYITSVYRFDFGGTPTA